MTSPVLVTGAAGFIGHHVVQRLAASGVAVVGADAFTSYYDTTLKEARWAELARLGTFVGERIDLSDGAAVRDLFERHKPDRVIHLAAQPGVRKALTKPDPYVAHNVVAFLQVLEACRHAGIKHLVYASSSSVYGANRKLPFSEHDPANHPVSLYAATKRSNELMAHSYAHLFGLPSTGLRFFTVYGPWGRPDMAVYKFTHAIAQRHPIEVAQGGRVWRDFTYVGDIAEGIVRILDKPAQADPAWDAEDPDPATAGVPHRVYNIGNDRPEELNHLIALIEEALGRKAVRIDAPLPPGDVLATRADLSDLRSEMGFAPTVKLREGVGRFVDWYRHYHGA
jgi:UDP-glucuronate 4-epimerase